MERLKEALLFKIFSYLDVPSLGRLGLVNKRLSEWALKYLDQDSCSPQLFYSCRPIGPANASNSNSQYVIRGLTNIFTMSEPLLKHNFREVGVMMKRITMLKSTSTRLSIAYSLLHRINLLVGSGSSEQLMRGLAIYFHAFVKGWRSDECVNAARCIVYNIASEISTLLQDSYKLGTIPMLEIHFRNFLRSFFINQTDRESRSFWQMTMVQILVPLREPEKIARLVFLATAPLKECSWIDGLQWKDHYEAVPACLSVANFRYQELVKILLNLDALGYKDLLMRVMNKLFLLPRAWIPENVASLLLIAGPRIIREYLAFCVQEALQSLSLNPSSLPSKEIFQPIGDIFLGLFIMQTRFRRPIDMILSRLDETVRGLPHSCRASFYAAVWAAIGREMQDVREGMEEDDDWCHQSRDLIFNIIKCLGVRLTEKGFLRKQPKEDEDPADTMQFEEAEE